MQNEKKEQDKVIKETFQNSDFYRFIVDSVEHYAIFAMDVDGRIVSWNPGVEKLLGYGEDEFIGRDGVMIFTEQDRAAGVLSAEMRNAEAGGKSLDRRWHVRQDGSRFWADGLMMPLQNDGELQGFVKMMRDDTERKMLELALSEKEGLYRSVVENYPNGAIFIFDRDFRYVVAEGRELGDTGFSPDFFIGKTLYEIITPEVAAVVEPCYRAALRGERGTSTIEYEDSVYEVFFAPVKDYGDDQNGEYSLGMMMTQNITERVRRTTELEVSRAETRTILESITDAFFSLDHDWRFTYVNKEAEKILFRTADQLLGKSIWQAFPEAANSTFDREYRKAVETGQTVSFEEFFAPLDSWFEVRAYPSEAGLSVYFHNVNERRRNEQALRESEENYRTLFNSIDEGFCVIELIFDENEKAVDWRFVQINPAFEKHNGLTDAVGKTIRELAPSIEDRWFEVYGRIAKTGESTRFEEFSEAFNRYFDVYAFRFGQPEEHRVAVLFNDVSERKRSEKALLETAAQLRLALEGGGMGAWSFDPQTNQAETDEKCLAMFGLTKKKYDGNADLIFNQIHPQDRERVSREIKEAIETNGIYQSEFRVIHDDKKVRWLAGIGRPEYDPETGAPSRVYGVNFDITNRRQTEEILRQSEERFRGLQQATPDGFMIFESVRDREGRIKDFRWVYVNPAAENIVGRREKDLVGKLLLSEMPGNREEGLFDAYVRVVETGELWRNEFSYKHENLDHYFLSTAVKTGDGFAVAFSDITTRKRVEREREQLLEKEKAARAEAENATRAKDAFLATVTHELRSPLNSILGWNNLLKKQPSPEMIERVTDIVERQGKQQLQLIEDLLDTARIVSGKMMIEQEAVDMAEVVSAALDVVRPAAQSKHIRLSMIIGGSGREVVTGDAERLQQVIWNLLSNAVKFTPEGGQVEIELRRDESFAAVVVTDNGKGIAPEFLPYVFERFSQADSSKSRRFGGLGLGLSLVKQLTELHGGTVEVSSEGEGKGARFLVKLPIRAIGSGENKANAELSAVWEAHEVHVSAGGTPLVQEDGKLSGARILVADDLADARELVRFALERHGARVEAYESGTAALGALGEAGVVNSHFDLFICDIGMPDADGYSIIKRLRQMEDERGGNLPAIALTAFSGAQDKIRALESGFQMHISKPVEPEELALMVASMLSVKKI